MSVQMVHSDVVDLGAVSGTGHDIEVQSVHLNTLHGHIGLVYDDDRPAYFTDHGDHRLHLWAGTSLAFTPETARALGEALIEWARMREVSGDADTA